MNVAKLICRQRNNRISAAKSLRRSQRLPRKVSTVCLLLVYFVYVCVDLPNVGHLGGGMGGGGGDIEGWCGCCCNIQSWYYTALIAGQSPRCTEVTSLDKVEITLSMGARNIKHTFIK